MIREQFFKSLVDFKPIEPNSIDEIYTLYMFETIDISDIITQALIESGYDFHDANDMVCATRYRAVEYTFLRKYNGYIHFNLYNAICNHLYDILHEFDIYYGHDLNIQSKLEVDGAIRHIFSIDNTYFKLNGVDIYRDGNKFYTNYNDQKIFINQYYFNIYGYKLLCGKPSINTDTHQPFGFITSWIKSQITFLYELDDTISIDKVKKLVDKPR